MAMGDVQSAISYGKRIESALEFSKQKVFQSEKFVYDYLNQKKINVIEIPFRFRRIRVEGNIHKRDLEVFSPEQQLTLDPLGENPHTTVWPLNLFYKRDHDDPSNVYCSPNDKLNVLDVKNFNIENKNNTLQSYISISENKNETVAFDAIKFMRNRKKRNNNNNNNYNDNNNGGYIFIEELQVSIDPSTEDEFIDHNRGIYNYYNNNNNNNNNNDNKRKQYNSTNYIINELRFNKNGNNDGYSRRRGGSSNSNYEDKIKRRKRRRIKKKFEIP